MAGRTRRATFQDPGGDLFAKYAHIKDRAARCIAFIEGECLVPEGRGTGKPYRLRPYQKRTIRRLLAKGVIVGVLSAPRGWTKSGLAAAIAVWAPSRLSRRNRVNQAGCVAIARRRPGLPGFCRGRGWAEGRFPDLPSPTPSRTEDRRLPAETG